MVHFFPKNLFKKIKSTVGLFVFLGKNWLETYFDNVYVPRPPSTRQSSRCPSKLRLRFPTLLDHDARVTRSILFLGSRVFHPPKTLFVLINDHTLWLFTGSRTRKHVPLRAHARFVITKSYCKTKIFTASSPSSVHGFRNYFRADFAKNVGHKSFSNCLASFRRARESLENMRTTLIGHMSYGVWCCSDC
jgi:hypothetical protein